MGRLASIWSTRTGLVIVLLALTAGTVAALAGFGSGVRDQALALVLAIGVAVGGFLLRRRAG